MSKLHEIAAQRRLDVAEAKKITSISQLVALTNQRLVELGGDPLNLLERVKSQPPILGARMHLAAEFKRASPSKGVMADESLSVEDQVTTYVKAQASLVSVLTEPKWFKGTLEDMATAKKTILLLNPEIRPLVLRKDFLVDEYQLYEARAYGADTVLLIVAILSDIELRHLITESRKLGMEPLVEAANEPETVRALECGAKVLGINNRDLTTFKVDLGTTNRCAAIAKPETGVCLLALSGIKTREDVVRYEPIEVVRGILVGEHLMTAQDPIKEIRSLVLDHDTEQKNTLVKICGLVRPEDALSACRAKANFIGLIFADKSPRKVTIDEAKAVAQAVRDYRETRSSIIIELPSYSKPSGSGDSNKKPRLSGWYEDAAASIRKASERGPLVVGVFMDHPLEFINECIEKVGLDLVQLHGSESWEMCSKVRVPVIKVVHIPAGSHNISDEVILASVEGGEGRAAGILLDTTVKGGAEGGTGVAFDWEVAAKFKAAGIPVIVAGGLVPDNVQQAIIQANRPFAVDCSSGVQKNEKTPREKDLTLIQAFVNKAKSLL